jgi:hypothetical protein
MFSFVPNVCGSSLRNLRNLLMSLLAPGIFRWLIDFFFNLCSPVLLWLKLHVAVFQRLFRFPSEGMFMTFLFVSHILRVVYIHSNDSSLVQNSRKNLKWLSDISKLQLRTLPMH